jgi:DNA-binding NtrC family response regulator
MSPSHDEIAVNRTSVVPNRIAANRWPLDWLNFFLADVKDGLGPFLAIFLMSSQHWDAGRIGVVLTIAGVATVLARGPGGALVDAVHWKRTLIAISALAVAIAAAVMVLAPQFWPIAVAQAISGIADAIFPLAVAAISLGIVGRGLFTRRVGRNEAFNHAGNAVTAIVAGLAGYFIAPGAVLWLIAALALASIAAVYAIDGRAIDHEVARGSDNGGRGHQPSRLSDLLENRSLVFFTAAITLFHFANAAMLPLIGEKLSQSNQQASSLFIAACIITAQIVMVPMAVLVGHKADARPASVDESEGETLVGSSEAMRRVQKTIGLAADSDATVLVLGETGTGKEMVARALHDHGRRKAKPFIAVNCAAIPGDLLESELFGHVKGAFTGAASDRTGAFREANGGTLLLDEIGDMPPTMQAKILRVLQDKVVMPVGGRPAAVDIRVIAATHRDLTEWIAEGRFREDLYYRLNIVRITLPPLRERLADILPLAEHFLRAVSAQAPKQLTAQAAARLLSRGWPGNVRELKNVIERANVFVRGNIIDAGDLDLASDIPRTSFAGPVDWLAGDLPTALARLEEAMIRRALDSCGGNRAEAARRLNVHRQLLYAKMQRYGLLHLDVSDATTAAVVKDDD